MPRRTWGETMSESRPPAALGTDIRCHCGKLMARWQGESLVIKCARCGRFVRIHSSPLLTRIIHFFVIGGQSQRNQGFEFEARGALIPRLEVNLAYTYLDTKFTASNDPRIVGTRAFNAPMHTVSAFRTYDFSDVLTKGLKLGAVVYYRGEVSAIPGRANQTYPDYTRFDIFALYAPLQWLSFQVNLNNVADARYVEGPFYHAGFNHFGAPRHVIGMVRMTF